jgi:hypothetical protein
MRAYKPTQLFGLIQNMDVTTMLFYGLTGPRGQRPITFRMPDNHILDEHRTKIQGNRFQNPPPAYSNSLRPTLAKVVFP